MKSHPIVRFVKTSPPAVKIALVVVLALAVWGGYKLFSGGGGPAGGPRGTTVAVETTPVTHGPIKDLGLFSGSLIPKTSFSIASKISGKLKKLLIDIGDGVSQGQLVAVIEDEEYQQQVLQAEADLRVAQANLSEAKSSLELSKRDLERARTLHAKGIQSDSQLDAAVAQSEAQESRFKVAQAQEANREAALATARVRLSYTQIRASWERGSAVRYVGERFVDEGAMLSTNTQILSIIDLHPITAVIFVSDRDYQRLQTGQETTITSSAFPGRSFAGRVVRIAPLLQETSREGRIEIEIQNPDNLLKPGMFITAQVQYAERADATLVPINALVQRNNQTGVFLADPETRKARFIPLKTGIVQGERAEVLDPAGLAGDIVTLGHHLLEDGVNIILPQKAGEAGGREGAAAGAPSKKKPAGSKPAAKTP